MRKNNVQVSSLGTARMTIDGTTKKEGDRSRVAVGERERKRERDSSRNAMIKQPEDRPTNNVGTGRRGRETSTDGKRKRGREKNVNAGWREGDWLRDQVGH